jgi:uncharacterized protein DUF4253
MRLSVFAAGVLWVACAQPRSAQLTDREATLGRAVGFPDSIVRLIKSEAGGELQGLVPLDSLGTPLPARGLMFGVRQSRVPAILRRLRNSLGPGYLVFEADRGFGIDPDSIGVLRSRDPFDMLRVRATNGANYDIHTDSIISRVQRWADTLGLELTAAGFDWLEGRFASRQPNWKALARELYAFCPDVVTQGTETVEALEAEMRRRQVLYCWWD